MISEPELELLYKFANAPVLKFPYPHFFVEGVFPKEFYDRLQSNIPDPSLMVPLAETGRVGKSAYRERFILEISSEKHRDLLPIDKREFWRDVAGWLCSGRLANVALQKFKSTIDSRFRGGPTPTFYNEAMLVEDITKYSLGPHTDTPRKVVTMLFYLPKDLSQSHLGTSIYLPKQQGFTCDGRAHHSFDRFMRLHTMPFLPNSLFVFCKTNNSFHGVEPVSDPDVRRWLLLFDIFARLPQTSPPTQ